VDKLGFAGYDETEDVCPALLYVDTYLVFSYRFRLSFCKDAISWRREETVRWLSDKSVSSCSFLFLNRSRCAVIIGRMPEPPPTGSPERKASKEVVPRDDDLGSNPDIIEEVGDVLPFRPTNDAELGFEDPWG
jgi:hypothetical protein